MLVNLRLIKFLVLVVQLMLSPLTTPISNLAYTRGDWLIYRYAVHGSILDVEVDCEFVVNITIEDVEEYKVVYYASWGIVRIDKGFDICIRVPESDKYTVDISYMAPASGEFIVDPTRSGIYNITYKGFIGKAEYYKGVLISLDASFYNLTTKIDLVNSSISELKHFAKPNYTYTITIPIHTPTTKTNITNTLASVSINHGHGYTTVLHIVVIAILSISIIVLASVWKKTKKYRYVKTLKKITKAYTAISSLI